MRLIKLVAQLEFIAAGTLLKRNVDGDYYITRSDELYMNSPIKMPPSMVISGTFLRDRPELYDIIEGMPNAQIMLTELRYAVLDGKGDSELLAQIAQLQQAVRVPEPESD